MRSSNLSGIILTHPHFTSSPMKNFLKLATAAALSLTFIAAHAQQADGKMMKKEEKGDAKMMMKTGKMANDRSMKKSDKMMKHDAKRDAKVETKGKTQSFVVHKRLLPGSFASGRSSGPGDVLRFLVVHKDFRKQNRHG